jgi:hypothetical protein
VFTDEERAVLLCVAPHGFVAQRLVPCEARVGFSLTRLAKPRRRNQLAMDELQRPVPEEAEPAPSAPAPEPEAAQAKKLIIWLQSSGGKQKFKVKSDTKFGSVFDAFCQSSGRERSSVTFSFDGDTVHPDTTPAQLDMDDDDVIDVKNKCK